jgi:hypothetical protein
LPKVLLCSPASFLSVFGLITRMRPHRASWWLFTWVLPVIPVVIAWDGLISHLRSYTECEMLDLTDGLTSEHYTWEVGRVRAPRGGLDISYLIGRPVPF